MVDIDGNLFLKFSFFVKKKRRKNPHFFDFLFQVDVYHMNDLLNNIFSPLVFIYRLINSIVLIKQFSNSPFIEHIHFNTEN